VSNLSVGWSVRVSGELQNGWLDLDAVWDGASAGFKDEATSWDWRSSHMKRQFWGVCGMFYCNKWEHCCVVVQ